MKIAILTFDGFNELDSLIASSLINRVKLPGWKAYIACPTQTVTSMNGVTIRAQQPLDYTGSADVVLFGSGVNTEEIVRDKGLFSRIRLKPAGRERL